MMTYTWLTNLGHLMMGCNSTWWQLCNLLFTKSYFQAVDKFCHPSSLVQSTWYVKSHFTLGSRQIDEWELSELVVIISQKLNFFCSMSNCLLLHWCQQLLCLCVGMEVAQTSCVALSPNYFAALWIVHCLVILMVLSWGLQIRERITSLIWWRQPDQRTARCSLSWMAIQAAVKWPVLEDVVSNVILISVTLITSSTGALELDSMLWRLRSQRVIIIIIIINNVIMTVPLSHQLHCQPGYNFTTWLFCSLGITWYPQ